MVGVGTCGNVVVAVGVVDEDVEVGPGADAGGELAGAVARPLACPCVGEETGLV